MKGDRKEAVDIKRMLSNAIRSGKIVFIDGEKRECERFHFDYKRRLIEIYREEGSGLSGIVPIEAVKEIIFVKESKNG